MSSDVASKLVLIAFAATLGAATLTSCGSVTPASDGGTAGASGGGAGGSTGGTTGVAGTTGAAGRGGAGGDADGGVLACRVDMSDCPTGFTCACGGAGPGMCTCHRNCTDTSACPATEPMCGCPGSMSAARFCVNACFCNCN